jgi:hypothetical protein
MIKGVYQSKPKKILVSIGDHVTRFMRKSWVAGWPRFLSIFVLVLIASSIVVFVGLTKLQTEYPKPQIVNEDRQAACLNIELESLSPADRLLTIQADYWLDTNATTNMSQSQDQEVRVWISKPYREPSGEESTTNATPEQSSTATVTITVSAKVGTPITTTKQPSTLVLGTVSGEPSKFPFDQYSASIGEQNDFNNALPFKFNIESHLAGFELASESGGNHTAIITLKRNRINKIIPFIPVFILLFYTSWVIYLLCWRKVKDNMSLVSNVALFLSILALRNLVVPNGIPIPCVFDVVLFIPLITIVVSSVVFGLQVMSPKHQ